ncbi:MULTISPECIES: spore germination protein GerPB [unclassified Bacillus (in: firmicutes)]|uniref:spore germination protein GerPB n=1 Tax=unclassified Bacillus (in: firmicutes) TaxID=185979 RepID=UPI00232E50D4|nr:spore germination protein GerPB [Bacillus sp. BP-3]MDC2863812.1 spore germination protein GerPB [Bacillus sp. BP-3]
MKLFVQQSIIINKIRIENLTTSAVFQIGSAGSIKTLSKFSNTGGFTQPAPPLTDPGQIISISPSPPSSS